MATPKMHSESKSRKPLTAERLRELLDYDPATGAFRWRKIPDRKNSYAGRPAGTANHHGYLSIRVDRVLYYAQRLAWLYMHGEWPPIYTDHKQGDTADNRLANLRPATTGQNAVNRGMDRRNKSGFKGVCYSTEKGKWRATINGRHIGYFKELQDAGAAYRDAADRLHGEFSTHLRRDIDKPKKKRAA